MPENRVKEISGEPIDLQAACAPESGTGEAPVDHHCQICPTCSHRLTSRRCKLICTHCGYYMSCADYY
jgi:hypothetical protein